MVSEKQIEALKDVLAHLVAAHSLLSRSPKTAAASDKMFDQMLADYQASIDMGQSSPHRRRASRTRSSRPIWRGEGEAVAVGVD